jgi:osmotically-inducible protein OsmY
MERRIRNIAVAALLGVAALTQSGCAVVAVGAAGTVAAMSANDRRTAGTQLDDTNIAGRVAYQLALVEALRANANIRVEVYNSVVLLTGQAPTQRLRQLAVDATQKVENISKIHNQIRIGSPATASTQANDIWIASKVRAQFVTDERVPTMNVSVVVEDAEVFLMGRLTTAEANAAVDVARNVKGVKKVVRAFELKS